MNSEFEPSDDDRERAAHDADQLMTIVTDGPSHLENLPKVDYPISDIVVNLDRLGSYLMLARTFYMPVYGMKTDRGVVVCDPICGLMSTTGRLDQFGRGILQDLWRGGGALARWFGQMRLLFVDEAVESTRSRLRSYLTTRIAATNGLTDQPSDSQAYPPYQTPPTTFLVDFKVYSVNKNLNIEVSPEYFVTFRYFGSPTSPAVGKVEAGTVFFRAHGPNVIDVVDPTVVEVPKNTSFTSQRF